MTRIDIKTKDGICPSYVYRPAGDGPWPAALVYMDGVGIRPAMLDLAERLSTYGYFVLLPDYFYRSGRTNRWTATGRSPIRRSARS
jgi:carboxymethylenebutenolidase